MNKVSAGVVTGLLLGAAQGALSLGENAKGVEQSLLPILGRASQGIIAGILTAYLTKGKAPLWQGALMGAAIGAGLGFLAGLPTHAWSQLVPYSAAVGLGCGVAVARASR
jgi:hypothetical protein